MAFHRVTNEFRNQVAFERCRLLVVEGKEQGREIAIPARGVVVGADAEADLVLNDAAVSRRHCQIIPKPEGLLVTDLGSKNGTLLDGVSLQGAIVPVGSVLRLGNSRVQLLSAEVGMVLPPSSADAFGAMTGESLAMRRIFSLLERASATMAPVLLIGESGTGKELAARAVHDNSPRRDESFVVFDCGAASENLIESDLFGHMRGAFTGADAARPGAFARAHQGTLFLDEIGDLPLTLQPKLLRLLETGEVTPLGGRKSERYDVRVVAATNKDLWQEVGRGTFRSDLYYRLAVVEVHLPPLRQRREDIPALVRLFLRKNNAPEDMIAGADLERLCAYSWPGNIRELRNVVTRAMALGGVGALKGQLPILLGAPRGQAPEAPTARADRPFAEAKAELLARFEREYLTDLMRVANGNLSQAARVSGIERKYLYKLLEKVGVPRPGAEEG